MKKIFIILITCILFIGCTTTETPETSVEPISEDSIYLESVMDIYENYIPILNTMVKLTVYNTEDSESIFNEVYEIAKKGHMLVDNYHYYRDDEGFTLQNIAIINDSYGTDTPITIDPYLFDLLKDAINMFKLTEGYFNPFMGNLIDLWSPKYSNFPIENTDYDEDTINKSLACVPTFEEIDDIFIMDESNYTVTFNKLDTCDTTVSINLGAYSKGAITDTLSQALNEKGIDYLLDVGTSNVYGYSSFDKTWTVGIRSPYNKVASIYVVELLSNQGLSTSGDDNQYFILRHDDDSITIRSHILNPFIGNSESYYRSVSVLTDGSSAVADVLSTALFSINDEQLQKDIVKRFEEYYNTEIDVAFIEEISYENQEVNLIVSKGFKEQLLDDYITKHIVNIIDWEK